MSLHHHYEVDELLASMEPTAIAPQDSPHQGSPAEYSHQARETGLAKPMTEHPTASSTLHDSSSELQKQHQQQKKRCDQSPSLPAENSSVSLSPSPSLSSSPSPPTPSSSLSAPRTLLPSITSSSRPSSGSASAKPSPLATISSAEVPSDLDALAASLNIEGLAAADAGSSSTTASTPTKPATSEREPSESHHHSSVAEDKVSALPPLLSASSRSMSFQVQPNLSEFRPVMVQKQASVMDVRVHDLPPRASSSQSHRTKQSPRGGAQLNKNGSPSRRRLTIATHEISHHALERLGVNTEMLKKEKGMKKLGISDVDIERSEEIRRYSGVPQHLSPATKVEFMFGFTKEQLLRAKAINRLGTSEEEVLDDYSRRVSRLGMHDTPIVSIK